MENIGERLVGDYLRIEKECDFIEYNQKDHLKRMVDKIKKTTGIEVRLMVNDEFYAAFLKLKEHAAKTTEELKSPVLRLLQIEAWLEKHLTQTYQIFSTISRKNVPLTDEDADILRKEKELLNEEQVEQGSNGFLQAMIAYEIEHDMTPMAGRINDNHRRKRSVRTQK